jgi:hypothetical protein
MHEDEKRKYKEQQASAFEKYSILVKQYKKDVEKFERENLGVVISSKTPKSSKMTKGTSTTPATVTKNLNTGQGGASSNTNHRHLNNISGTAIYETPAPKRGRGRPRKNVAPKNDMVLSFLNDNYKVSDVVAVTGERALTFPAVLMLIYHSFSVSFTGYYVEPL